MKEMALAEAGSRGPLLRLRRNLRNIPARDLHCIKKRGDRPTGAGVGVAPISALERSPTSLKAPAAVAASQAGLFSGRLNSRVFLRYEDH